MNRYLLAGLVGFGLLFTGSISANSTPLAPTADTMIEKVHGYHRNCRRGHRHTRWGERRSCDHHYGHSASRIADVTTFPQSQTRNRDHTK